MALEDTDAALKAIDAKQNRMLHFGWHLRSPQAHGELGTSARLCWWPAAHLGPTAARGQYELRITRFRDDSFYGHDVEKTVYWLDDLEAVSERLRAHDFALEDMEIKPTQRRQR